MVELVTVVPPVLAGMAIAAWAGVVVRRLLKADGATTGE
jgi:hypothetical protein